MKFTIIVDYDPDERVYNVSVPSLPGCFTWGSTEEKAVENAKDAIRCYLDMLREAGDPIPRPVGLREVTV